MMQNPPTLYKIPARTLALIALLMLGIGYCYNYYVFHIQKADFINYHGMLGQSFMEGHTHLNIEPSQDMMSLTDPYGDPLRYKYGQWDSSFYNGKYYLYFGPVPAALFWVPIKFITGISITDPMMTLCFTIAGTACLLLLFTSIATQQRLLSQPALLFCIIALALGTWLPFMLRRASFYEVAVSGAYFFNALGMLLLWKGLHARTTFKWFLAGGLCMGLAIGCRHLHVFNACFLLSAWAATERTRNVKNLLALFLPWLFVIGCLMVYNYVRFDSPLETGQRYIISVFNMNDPNFKAMRFDKIPDGIYYYLLRALDWKDDFTFPFLKVTYYDKRTIFGSIDVEALEPTYGLLANSPLAVALFALPFLWWHGKISPTRETIVLLGSMSIFTACIFLFLCMFVYSTVRYAVDFSPWFMFLAALIYLQLVSTTTSRSGRMLLLVTGGAAAAYGAFTGLMSGYCGQFLCEKM